jgi:NADH-quinone oxidoreductase subunit A
MSSAVLGRRGLASRPGRGVPLTRRARRGEPMDAYLPLVVMLVLAGLFLFLSFFASTLLAPQSPNPAKRAFYESGIVPEHESSERFPVKFYMVAMAFIVFDVEVVFLYPWAVTLDDVGTYGLVAMGLFALPFVISFAYELSQGVLDWGPQLPERRAAGAVKRTSTVDLSDLEGSATPTSGQAA